MQDIWVPLHSIHSRSTLFRKLHHRPTLDIATSATTPLKTSSCDVLFKILLGILGYWTLSIWDLFEVGTPTRPPRCRPCQTLCSYARRSGCLFTSFDQNHNLVFSLFWSIKPAMLSASMLRDYSTSASSTPSWFPRRTDLIGKPDSHHVVTRLTFSSSFLDHHAGHPSRHDARILLMSASLMPSKSFHRRFDLLESCFL
jgi:hypothetical protein